MSLPDLSIQEVTDQYIRKNFEKLRDFFRSESPLLGFKHFELSFQQTGNMTIPHNLGFQPKDIVQTSLIGSGQVAFTYSNFTKDFLTLTVTGTVSSAVPTVVRFFAGSYVEGAQ